MGNNQKRVEVVDQETGEVFGLNTGMLISNVRDVLMSKRRQQMVAMTWSQLGEQQQKDEIQDLTNLAEELVEKIVELVAQAGRDVIHAQLDNFKVKDGAVTVTAKGAADDGAILALNSIGKKNLKIVVADAGQFDEQRDEIVPTPDQNDMFPDEEDQEPMGEQEVDDLAAEMDKQLDEMEEPDDLHEQDGDATEEAQPANQEEQTQAAETEAGDGNTAPDVSPAQAGQDARLKGAGPDENPYDGGSIEAGEWQGAYNDADEQIKSLISDGVKAADEGKTVKDCPWKSGTDGERFWLEGFNSVPKPETVDE